jgi:hypothetical protein
VANSAQKNATLCWEHVKGGPSKLCAFGCDLLWYHLVWESMVDAPHSFPNGPVVPFCLGYVLIRSAAIESDVHYAKSCASFSSNVK